MDQILSAEECSLATKVKATRGDRLCPVTSWAKISGLLDAKMCSEQLTHMASQLLLITPFWGCWSCSAQVTGDSRRRNPRKVPELAVAKLRLKSGLTPHSLV